MTLSLVGEKTYGINSEITLTWGNKSIKVGESVSQITDNTTFIFSIPQEASGDAAIAV
jgi:hypothetical protein